jgi:hypothetical protein
MLAVYAAEAVTGFEQAHFLTVPILHGKEEVRFVCQRRQLQAKYRLGRNPERSSFPKALVRGQLRAGASTGAPGRKSLQLSIFLTIFKTGERRNPSLGRFDSCAAPFPGPTSGRRPAP